MHQIILWLELCPRSHWDAHSAPPDPLAGFKVPTSKERSGGTGEGGGGTGKGREGEGYYRGGRE